MIDGEEVRSFARNWGVSRSQVFRDHLISHLLHALEGTPGVVFFGGTALSRSHLEGRRLSEDVDLYLDPTSPADRGELVATLQQGTRRDFPGLRVEQVARLSDVTTYDVSYGDVSVKLQIVAARPEHRAYPVAETAVVLHYSDLAPTAQLTVPTIPAFGAMKLGAYEDRHAARDLFDLAGLVAIDGVTLESLVILRRVRGVGAIKHQYEDGFRPTDGEWQAELGHQTKALGDPGDALEIVWSTLVEIGAW